MLKFTKMNGAGNDFVLLDNRDRALRLGREEIALLCDRHRGVGADGLLLVEPPANGADYRMRYYNADGGEAEMCGNGARCFARFVQKIAGGAGEVSFETQAGVIRGRCLGENVQVAMSDPHSLALGQVLDVAGEEIVVHAINTGVPHAVVFVDDLEKVDVRALGSALRHHSHFAPQGTNVNFACRIDAHTVAIRTYERGVEDETLACGTGVVAAALILHEKHGAPSPVSVKVRGGETLEVSFAHEGGAYRHIALTGPAEFVFEGQIEI